MGQVVKIPSQLLGFGIFMFSNSYFIARFFPFSLKTIFISPFISVVSINLFRRNSSKVFLIRYCLCRFCFLYQSANDLRTIPKPGNTISVPITTPAVAMPTAVKRILLVIFPLSTFSLNIPFFIFWPY